MIWRSRLKVSQEAINLIRRSAQNISSGLRLNPGVSYTVIHQQIRKTQKSTCWWENSFKWHAIIWALICLLVIHWCLQFARYTIYIYRLRVTLYIFYDHVIIKETIWFIINFELSSILPQGRGLVLHFDIVSTHEYVWIHEVWYSQTNYKLVHFERDAHSWPCTPLRYQIMFSQKFGYYSISCW